MTTRPGAPAAVRADDWGWRYSGRRSWAARGLTLRVEPGERVLLLGASGAGKSTLLAGLAGVLGGDDDGEAEGALTVAGSRPSAARGTTGLLLQDPESQIVLARVGDDVAFGCENIGLPRDQIWPRVGWALASVGLDLPLDRPTSQLSGGQKQRLALAGLLAMQPGLLLLDEPTANLDPEAAVEVRDAVGAVLRATGATAIVVEHRVDLWREIVDRVVVLDPDGGVLADGPPDAVLADPSGELARAGVWLTGAGEATPPLIEPGERLLTARGLVFGRGPAITGQRRWGRSRRAARRATGIALPHHVDLDLAEGSALALTGRNGSGKSTLALTLGGLLPVFGGTLEAHSALAGQASVRPAEWASRELLTRIGSVFQDPEHQFLTSRVRDELAAGPRALRLPASEVEERVDALLAGLFLTELADANPFTLSGGQKRRLSVGTALATRPRLLLLDEPTFGQDANTWRSLVDLIVGLRAEGHAIVAATHDDAFIAAVGAAELRLASPAEVSA
ncbi:ABC transporter ATP-binding protein [Leifsonia sp. AG29]|uniref:ABC transporter ATP-binding protein n=1 Tax=Leifsonia sp. AG29 TaxID=2598860 RepID=UPI00131B4DD5|nr:ABC transporter ATP-binding protein [Leifsonia sp. AG29]